MREYREIAPENDPCIHLCLWRNKTSTLVMMNLLYPAFANSVDPEQLASEDANWSGSALFAIKYLKYSNNLDQIIWLAEN